MAGEFTCALRPSAGAPDHEFGDEVAGWRADVQCQQTEAGGIAGQVASYGRRRFRAKFQPVSLKLPEIAR